MERLDFKLRKMEIGILLIAILLGVVGQVFFKLGVERAGGAGIELNSVINIIRLMLTPTVIIGLSFYGLSTILYLYSLDKIPQSIAFPSLSLGYVVILMYNSIYFDEKITFSKVFGILAIIGGVSMLFGLHNSIIALVRK